MKSLIAELKRANRRNRALPSLSQQPVHVLYGGAHLFTARTPGKLAELAKKSLLENAPTPEEFDRILGLARAHRVHERVLDKLERQAIEDLRIDFEDGYGQRPDKEEDLEAKRAAQELTQAIKQNLMPPFFGIRVKSLSDATAERALRTLDIFLSSFVAAQGRRIPENFVVTLPKVASAEQGRIFAKALTQLEKKLKIKADSLRFEVLVELPELLMNQEGICELPRLRGVAKGRLRGAHFGIYDYLSNCDVASSNQELTHPACDHARMIMQTAFSGTDVQLSDGATHVIPSGTDRARILNAWRLSYRHIRHSLAHGFYQGWDLHPAQVPVRYAAIFSFFSENLEGSAKRMKNFLDTAARASLVGAHFDDEASAQGLLGFFVRGFSSGAFDSNDLASAGLTPEMLKTRSFKKLMAAERSPKPRSRST
ncbi:MAG: phosphoenolpyruvate kinase [Oligoflexia bacterium]|nr:phosphoenolpyruvate kinase [Oligoflexia bacterium]